MTEQSKEMVQRPEEQPEHVRAEHRVTPPVDVFENDDEILLMVDVPGVPQDGLSIQVDGGQLDIEARQPPGETENRSFEPVLFARSFTVPNAVDPSEVAAELEMGVLQVHLPKSEAAKPRRIAVKAG